MSITTYGKYLDKELTIEANEILSSHGGEVSSDHVPLMKPTKKAPHIQTSAVTKGNIR